MIDMDTCTGDEKMNWMGLYHNGFNPEVALRVQDVMIGQLP